MGLTEHNIPNTLKEVGEARIKLKTLATTVFKGFKNQFENRYNGCEDDEESLNFTEETEEAKLFIFPSGK